VHFDRANGLGALDPVCIRVGADLTIGRWHKVRAAQQPSPPYHRDIVNIQPRRHHRPVLRLRFNREGERAAAGVSWVGRSVVSWAGRVCQLVQ
jgi:hypothetical protein